MPSRQRGTSAPGDVTQVFEFDDDLDTGRLGNTLRTVSVTVAAGTTFTAQLSGTYGEGSILIELRDAQGRGIAATGMPRGQSSRLDTKIPATGLYRLLLTAPGNPTNAKLRITYTGPR